MATILSLSPPPPPLSLSLSLSHSHSMCVSCWVGAILCIYSIPAPPVACKNHSTQNKSFIFFNRDNREELKELQEDEKKEIQKKENARYVADKLIFPGGCFDSKSSFKRWWT